MKILLDECLPRRLATLLTGNEVKTIRQMRWNGKTNGELLALAAEHFDVFLTVDKNLLHLQEIKQRSLAVVVLRTKSNKSEDIEPHLPELLSVLKRIQPNQIVRVPKS